MSFGEAIAGLLRRGYRGEVDAEAGARELAQLRFKEEAERQAAADRAAAAAAAQRQAEEEARAARRARRAAAIREAEPGMEEGAELVLAVVRVRELAQRQVDRINALSAASNSDDAPFRLSGSHYYLRGRLERLGVLLLSAIPPTVPLPAARERPQRWTGDTFVAEELQHFRARLLPDPDGPPPNEEARP